MMLILEFVTFQYIPFKGKASITWCRRSINSRIRIDHKIHALNIIKLIGPGNPGRASAVYAFNQSCSRACSSICKLPLRSSIWVRRLPNLQEISWIHIQIENTFWSLWEPRLSTLQNVVVSRVSGCARVWRAN